MTKYRDEIEPMGYHYFRMNHSQTLALKEALIRKEKIAALRETTGEEDEQLLNLLVDIGIDNDTINVLHLVPLLEVAWADDEIQSGEERLLRQLADSRGIAEGSRAYELFESWLDKKPADPVFDACSQVVKHMLKHLPDSGEARQDLEQRINEVAKISGGLFGIGSISKEEREIISKLTKTFLDE